jgi:hypothetical protein
MEERWFMRATTSRVLMMGTMFTWLHGCQAGSVDRPAGGGDGGASTEPVGGGDLDGGADLPDAAREPRGDAGDEGGMASGPDAGEHDAGETSSETVIDGVRHPGLISREDELLRVRANVNGADAHPMQEGFAKLRSTRYASLAYETHPYAVVHVVGSGSNAEERAMRDDALAAYAHALQWVVTEEQAHADKTMQVIADWAGTLEDVVPTAGSPGVQDELEVAWYAPMWLAAAELLRFHRQGAAGWPAVQQAAFDGMVRLFKEKADAWAGSQGCCPNQALSVVLSRLSIGVYTSDRAYFDEALSYFRDSVLARSIAGDGEVLEINRIDGGDCGHATYNIEAIFDIAEIAWHQDVDLYADPRLPAGLEYLAQCITEGVDTSREGHVQCASMRPNSIEIAQNHYRGRLGQGGLPFTAALLGLVRPADQGTGKFLPWDTLTHAGLDGP